jgi:4-hydroxy-4-methyl-2-oxoglutarate aldolase
MEHQAMTQVEAVPVRKVSPLLYKTPIVPPVIGRNVPRPPAELVERFRSVFLPDISDKVGQLYTMDSGIRPLYQPIRRLVGVALTVKMPPGDNMMVQLALAEAQPGDVLVVDWRGYTEACGTGTGSLTSGIARGLAGVVIDGGWRDVAEIQALDFPIFARSISPFSTGKGRAGEINVPVACGGVIVNPGDIVVCDQEGGVVIPRLHAQAVADSLHEYHLNESVDAWRAERGGEGYAAQGRQYEEMFLAQGGVYVDGSAEGR